MAERPIRIVAIQPAHADAWATMRGALWPDVADGHREEIAAQLAAPSPESANRIAFDDAGRPVGFAEAAIRHDYVNGCEGSPVLFLEGLYVVPEARRRGVARQLIAAIAAWGRAIGLRDFASDAPLDNAASHALHAALGFVETERVVFFRCPLGAA